MIFDFDFTKLISPESGVVGGIVFLINGVINVVRAKVRASSADKASETQREGNLLAAMIAFQTQQTRLNGEMGREMDRQRGALDDQRNALAECRRAHDECVERATQTEVRIGTLEAERAALAERVAYLERHLAGVGFVDLAPIRHGPGL